MTVDLTDPKAVARDIVFTLAPVQWCDVADIVTASASQPELPLTNLADELSAIAQQAVRAEQYTRSRARGRTHDQAVTDSNRTIARVRKALGFSYPDNPVFF